MVAGPGAGREQAVSGRDFVHRGFGGAAVAGDIAPSVLLVATRNEVRVLVADWTDARLVADHYGFLVWSGVGPGGLPLTACSSGLGSASAAVAIEELATLGARTILGLGTTRAPLDAGDSGDSDDPRRVLIADGTWRADAASHGYARIEFPAAAHPEAVLALVAAAGEAGRRPAHVIAADVEAALATTVGTPPIRTARSAALEAALAEAGTVPVTGSPATLFVQAAVHGLRAGLLVADAGAPGSAVDARAIATRALGILAGWDDGADGRPVPWADRLAALAPERLGVLRAGGDEPGTR
jgi:uridine phosphorylase